jgi:hypothetical protein
LRCHLYINTPSFYQDRLGTNVARENSQRDTLFSCRPSRSRRACSTQPLHLA